MEQTPIIFKIGEENKPVVYGLDNFQESIFKDQLMLFFKHLQRKLEQKSKDNAIFNDIYDNNIIAFIGERGAGKTSCMYSALKIVKDAQEKDDWRPIYGEHYKPKKKIKLLKTIDPSFFDTKHNILEMLIGEMYRELKQSKERNSPDLNRDELHTLLAQFQETKRHLRFLATASNPFSQDDELEELDYLSSGAELRDSISLLVQRFLKLTGDDVLMIGIDDIDLNTKQAYSMVEKIRKYLILPHVVILFAVKLDQLESVIQLELATQFKDVRNNEYGSVSDSDISEMAERYLNKLIPLQARIFIPGPSSFFDRPLTVKDIAGNKKEYTSIREAVPSLIFAKCRYLFYNTRGTTSLIVPRNLRDLRMLVRMLFVMDDYNKEDSADTLSANKSQFRHYFFGTWLEDMDMRYKNIAHSLVNEIEPTLFNKKVLDLLDSVCSIRRKHQMANPVIGSIMNPSNMAYNISVGDVFCVLRWLDDMDTSADLHKLIFFIKSLYSIKLYEFYDEMTEPHQDNLDNKEKPYRGESLENITSYGKLSAGSFFLLEGDTLLPKEDSSFEREIRNIQGGRLLKLIKDLVDDYNQASDKSELFTQDDYITRLHAAEFFMLTVSRYIWTADKSIIESGIHQYRLQPKAYYDRKFDPGTESMMFDILAPFFTLADIKHSYERFNNEIFGIAQQCADSLYNKLHQNVVDDGRSYLSRACLRNAEVIDDLFTKMQSQRGQYRTSDNCEIIQSFYSNLASYTICTYDKWQDEDNGNKEKYYKITYPCFTLLSQLFENEDFIKIVDDIYNRPPKSAMETAIELTYPDIWHTYKTMKGKTVMSRMKKYYPDLYERIGEDDLNNIFDSEKSYKRDIVIGKIANTFTERPDVILPLQSNAQTEGGADDSSPEDEPSAPEEETTQSE